MVAREIIELQRQQPFPGLRIHISDGQSYEIRHPELMLVTKTKVVIALPASADEVPEKTVYCDPIHITRIEPLAAGAAT